MYFVTLDRRRLVCFQIMHQRMSNEMPANTAQGISESMYDRAVTTDFS